MRNTFNVAFYCRTSKANKEGLAPIELSISVNNKRLFKNLPFKCKPNDFNKRKRPQDIERYLDAVKKNINEYTIQMAELGITMTAQNLLDVISTGGVHQYTVGDMFTEYLKILEQRIGTDLSLGVYRKYELVHNLFAQYVADDTEITTVSNAQIKRFQGILNSRYDNSTAAGYLTKLKAFFRFAMDNGHLKVNPFATIKISREKKEIAVLTEGEMKALKEKDLHIDRLNKVRDIWLFQASSGLAYADMVELTPDDIQENNGVYYINKRRVKTDTEYTSVILQDGIDILKKYDYQLPKISNQRLNAYLKEIQDICQIKTNLHSHLARHQYCTTLLNKGVRIETVAKAAGHRNTKITQYFYAKMLNNTVISEIGSIVS